MSLKVKKENSLILDIRQHDNGVVSLVTKLVEMDIAKCYDAFETNTSGDHNEDERIRGELRGYRNLIRQLGREIHIPEEKKN